MAWFSVLRSLSLPLVFLVTNVVVLYLVLILSRRSSARRDPPQPTQAFAPRGTPPPLQAADILEWEWEYARTTASEAMQDRHTMINYYLVAAAFISSAVVAALGQDVALPYGVGTILLWLLTCIGWFYFLKIIKLRQSWYDSARAMNQIKDFFLHYSDIDAETLRRAFRWQPETLPPPGKPWTVYFYSATLIAFLNTFAYLIGSLLVVLDPQVTPAVQALRMLPGAAMIWLCVFAFGLFTFHVWLYFAFFATPAARNPAPGGLRSALKE